MGDGGGGQWLQLTNDWCIPVTALIISYKNTDMAEKLFTRMPTTKINLHSRVHYTIAVFTKVCQMSQSEKKWYLTQYQGSCGNLRHNKEGVSVCVCVGGGCHSATNLWPVLCFICIILFFQYNMSFQPKLLQNWEVPKRHKEVHE